MREEKAEMWGQNVDIRGQIKGLGAKRGKGSLKEQIWGQKGHIWGEKKGGFREKKWGFGGENAALWGKEEQFWGKKWGIQGRKAFWWKTGGKTYWVVAITRGY